MKFQKVLTRLCDSRSVPGLIDNCTSDERSSRTRSCGDRRLSPVGLNEPARVCTVMNIMDWIHLICYFFYELQNL